ncbi:ATPase domain-containing protein [Siminovitchia sediminis]|uniref:ATPase domain-containing protein n=1 Tax=Siminovitchia sediminis TaxID=1274353 RepID=A0ABW4KJF7_9BACI
MTGSIHSGVDGLDEILCGGIPKGTTVVVEGAPGTGKTTLGMQFLHYGAAQCEEGGLFITFEEFPEQIYKDMSAFGWDISLLEKENKLRVVCLSPEILLEQMQLPNGLFDQLVREIDCKSLVVDSISLLKLHGQEKERMVLYSLRNILRKFQLTSLLIQEQQATAGETIPFEHYIFDGVIQLKLSRHMEMFRKRTLEVLKMRGSRLIEGEHVYRITEQGIHLIVSARAALDKQASDPEGKIKTGIEKLDELLGGGLEQGSVYMLDTNSKANYRHMIGAILAKRIKEDYKVLHLLPSIESIAELIGLLKLHQVPLTEKIKEQLYFIEHYDRKVPPGWEQNVFQVQSLDNEEYKACLREIYQTLMLGRKEHKWFIYYDLNTIFIERGKDYVLQSFVKDMAAARSMGMTVLVLCNFKEVGERVSSFLARSSNGVLKTWVDGSYQYLQVVKAPDGRISPPYVIENIGQDPYIRLL